MERRLAVPDGDDELVADEDEDLTELDLLGVGDPARSLEDDEQSVAVHLELRALVGLDRVLDCKLVEVELEPDRLELLLAWLQKPEPHEAAVLVRCLKGVFEREVSLAPPAVLIDRAVDDHTADYPAPPRATARQGVRAVAGVAGSSSTRPRRCSTARCAGPFPGPARVGIATPGARR